MRKKRYKEGQIIQILQELESGIAMTEICRHYQVSRATVYRWKQQYHGMNKTELVRLKELEQENARLKKIVVQQALDINALKEMLGKEW